MRFYTLNRLGDPVQELDVIKWSLWFENSDRQVAINFIGNGDVIVSTVFLGIDHSFVEDGPPILWETMIFCTDGSFHKEWDLYQVRYSSLAEAKEGHKRAVEKISYALS